MKKGKRSPRQYQNPKTIDEARAYHATILLDIRSIDEQLADPNRRAAYGKSMQSIGDFEVWKTRANQAKEHLKIELQRLEAWISSYEAGTLQTVELPKPANEPSAPTKQDKKLLVLIGRAQQFMLRLKADGFEFGPDEQDLLAQNSRQLLGGDIATSTFTPLELARTTKDANAQIAIMIASYVAAVSTDPKDGAKLNLALENFFGSVNDAILDDNVMPRAINALLSQGDVEHAVTFFRRIGSSAATLRGVRAGCHIYEKTANPEHLAATVAIAEQLPQDAASIAWALIYGSTKDGKFLSRTERSLQACVDFRMESIRLDGIRLAVLRSSCKALGQGGADELLHSIVDGENRLAGLLCVCERWPESRYLQTALAEARLIDQISFRAFRYLVDMCALVGDWKAARELGECATLEMSCYARSVSMAIAEPAIKETMIASAGSAAAQLLVNTSQAARSEALSAYAWALAVLGKTDEAIAVAKLIFVPLWRCRTFLAIHKVQSGQVSILDVEL